MLYLDIAVKLVRVMWYWICRGFSPHKQVGFDPNFYKIYYTDVAGFSDQQLLCHFTHRGRMEGRFCSPQAAIGFFEGRFGRLPADFNSQGYAALNIDLKSAYTYDWQFVIHYLQFGRAEGRRYLTKVMNQPSRVNYEYTYRLTMPDGVVPSRRPANAQDFALATPFDASARSYKISGPIAAVIHCFYPEVFPMILGKLELVPVGVDLFISTDSEAKKTELERRCANWHKGTVTVRTVPNRGRDIAAKIIGFRDVYDKYELFIHLHTKKSPHGGEGLARWRDWLIDNNLGSEEIISSILSLFDDPRIGIVFPQHFFDLRGVLNWGYDFGLAKGLLKRLGISLNKNFTLEFPSGSMFWGRSAALRPLFQANLEYEDFPPEDGQIDGTLAHAIERSVLMIAESQGFEWLKVCMKKSYPLPETVLPVADRLDVRRHRLLVFQPCLSPLGAFVAPQARASRETQRLPAYPSRNTKPRLNLLVPTVNPRQSFGGLASAQKVFNEIGNALGSDFDRRIVSTDAAIEIEGYAALSPYVPTALTPSLDEVEWSLVDASDREYGRLDLRAADVFIATAWWTARLALELADERRRFFGVEHPFIYLIQDDEPFFYGWGSRYVAADETYRHPKSTIAIVNSEELYFVMRNKYRFAGCFCMPYTINEEISRLLDPQPRERRILVYGRPSATRNAFELIHSALFAWQQRDPVRASRWQIVFLGETFNADLLDPLQNAIVVGKVSLEDYAAHLNVAAVGISLMISPHPSYPPLEMAEAGLLTVTNDYPGKEMQRRHPGLNALPHPSTEVLAETIEDIVSKAEQFIGTPASRRSVAPLPIVPSEVFDPVHIGEMLRKYSRGAKTYDIASL